MFLLNSLQTKKGLTKLQIKKIFYYSSDYELGLLYDKYDEEFSLINNFITRQTGVLKMSKNFIDTDYIFTNSTQII
jgi:hypothetical protein